MQRKKRRVYKSLRTPDQATQTPQQQEPLDEEPKNKEKRSVCSSLSQVWMIKDQNVKKMRQVESFVYKAVQCKEPAVSKRMIILVALTSVLCAIAAYVTRGTLFEPPPPPGHLKHLMRILMDFILILAHPTVWFFNHIN
ncbi:hypothetical protein O3M35_008182 [Rhynocoris fuscipes]|uniref:PGG domain-containing protein n=1 Tax=Rhynocoris fuscipes TaxID=488301 RepID=A0AAW1D6V5_9HEMI